MSSTTQCTGRHTKHSGNIAPEQSAVPVKAGEGHIILVGKATRSASVQCQENPSSFAHLLLNYSRCPKPETDAAQNAIGERTHDLKGR